MSFFVYKNSDSGGQKRLRFLAGGTGMFGTFLLIFSSLFLEPEWFAIAAAIEGGDLLIFLTFLFFLHLEQRQYALRYFFLGKEYQAQMAEVLPHFAALDEKRRKELIADCKRSYRVFGRVLQAGNYVNKSLFRKPKELAVLRQMVRELLAACDRGDGWLGFIGACDSGAFACERTNYEGIKISDPLDGWEVKDMLDCSLFSYAFRYLVFCVFDLCSFTVVDTGISEEYTAENQKTKETLRSVYTPVLLTFREELRGVLDKLEQCVPDA